MEVIWGHHYVFADNSRLKRARDMDVVSLCLSCYDASNGMQHDLLGSIFDLTWPWPEVKYWHDLSRSPCICLGAFWREEHDGARSMTLAFVVLKLYAKTKTAILRFFLPLADKLLTLAQIWRILISSHRPVSSIDQLKRYRALFSAAP